MIKTQTPVTPIKSGIKSVQTLKGFRDFLPKEARKREYVINIFKEVFSSFGFEPLETPALEYEEILLGKYGEEGDKLMYRFEDNGKRKVALRYDQTVPLSRVIAQYKNELPMPFKRFQIQPVYRAENTQKGRFREFVQCDIDTVGTLSPLADAEIIAVAAKCLEKLGFKNFKVLINDRKSLFKFQEGFEPNLEQGLKIIRAVDKLKKIGREKVLEEITKLEITNKLASEILDAMEKKTPSSDLENIINYSVNLGMRNDQLKFDPLLARGLDYYTGLIFEIEIDGYTAGSVCGGGRYDQLIGMFLPRSKAGAGQDIPAVGCAFGFDRILEAMEQFDLFPKEMQTTKVLVTIFSPELKDKSIEVSTSLRANNINTELYLDENSTLQKQLKYADQKNIPYVIVIGPDETTKNILTLKNMKTREQQQLSCEQLLKFIF